MGVIQTHSAACGAVLIRFPLIDPVVDIRHDKVITAATEFFTHPAIFRLMMNGAARIFVPSWFR